ncbi:glycosyltransferase family 9 protein [Desulfonatronospira sp.]|uniref:glycosyltransferase family 9 protein n=1 Tax=Desulfonatronospira sp. TaxID=1962951 RepID=UPI0025C14124|nr:glycosyltransferase family 9 protein [Desulfonatronospira sp.]
MKKNTSDNIIFVHKGALGDFLLAWPALLSIRTFFRQAEIFWHGRDAFLPWLHPLGIKKAPYQAASALDGLYSSTGWPRALNKTTVFWFGVDRITVACSHPQLFFLTAVSSAKIRHVRNNYIHQLHNLNIPFNRKWQETWMDLFAANASREMALIFPGSGNPAKNWPLQNFLWAGECFKNAGYKTLLVLGPAEEKLDLSGSRLKQMRCTTLEELQGLILKSRILLGNDSGPMHLGAMFNKPGLVLFGPTPLRIWRPPGMRALKSPAHCAPCSTTARIRCQQPTCMQAVTRKHFRAWMDNFLNFKDAGL